MHPGQLISRHWGDQVLEEDVTWANSRLPLPRKQSGKDSSDTCPWIEHWRWRKRWPPRGKRRANAPPNLLGARPGVLSAQEANRWDHLNPTWKREGAIKCSSSFSSTFKGWRHGSSQLGSNLSCFKTESTIVVAKTLVAIRDAGKERKWSWSGYPAWHTVSGAIAPARSYWQ